MRDTAAIAIAAAALPATAYLLINQNFAYIYLAACLYSVALVYLLSASWLKNLFLAISAVLASVMATEILLGVLALGDDHAGSTIAYERGYSEPWLYRGGPLGYGATPSKTVRAWKAIGSDKLYEVVYTIDDHGLRKVPDMQKDAAGRGALLLFGGSITFGEGLNDDQTMAYYFARESSFSRPVINLGFSGYGPHQMLRMLETGMLDGLLSGPVRAAVYVALPHHVDRAAGEAWWDPVGPKYELDAGGRIGYVGPFTAVPGWLTPIYYRMLQVLEVARRSRVVDRIVDTFNRGRADPRSKVRTFTAIVAEAARILDEVYGAEFHVLLWDDDTELSAWVLASLRASNLETIEVSSYIPIADRAAYTIPQDGHPTAAANQILAEALARQLLVP